MYGGTFNLRKHLIQHPRSTIWPGIKKKKKEQILLYLPYQPRHFTCHLQYQTNVTCTSFFFQQSYQTGFDIYCC